MSTFLLLWWKALVGAIVGAIFIWPVATWVGGMHERHLEEAHNAVAVAAALKTNQIAQEHSAAQQAADAQAVAQTQKVLTDAVADLADETPTVRDVALACARLREQGTDVSGVAACRGVAPSAQAGTLHIRLK